MSGVKVLLIAFSIIPVICLILFLIFIYGMTAGHQPRKNKLELDSHAIYVSERNGNLQYSLEEYRYDLLIARFEPENNIADVQLLIWLRHIPVLIPY